MVVFGSLAGTSCLLSTHTNDNLLAGLKILCLANIKALAVADLAVSFYFLHALCRDLRWVKLFHFSPGLSVSGMKCC